MGFVSICVSLFFGRDNCPFGSPVFEESIDLSPATFWSDYSSSCWALSIMIVRRVEGGGRQAGIESTWKRIRLKSDSGNQFLFDITRGTGPEESTRTCELEEKHEKTLQTTATWLCCTLWSERASGRWSAGRQAGSNSLI